MKRQTFKEFLLESDVKKVHLGLRKVKKQTDKKYVFYLIKTVADVGYYDKLDDSVFKKKYNEIMSYIETNPNFKNVIEKNSVETDFSVLNQWNKDN